jgi:hypothetical protein
LEEKAGFIEYVLNREKSEIRSNLSEYAEYHGVSRETLYVLRRKFIEAFEERSPGPKIKATEQIVRELEEEFRKQRQEYELLQKELGHLQQEQAKQKERLLRTLLQVSVSPMSAREIKALIETAFGIKISKSKIKRLIAGYSIKAREILKSLGIEDLIKFLSIDEVFSGCAPVLTGIDLESFAVVICEKAQSRNHEVWHKMLTLFPHLKLVTSDRAKGIMKAVYLCADVRHQFDLFHFKRTTTKVLQRFESRAYSKIEAEYKARTKVEKSKNDLQRQIMLEIYWKLKQEALQAIETFDQMEKSIHTIYSALEIFDTDGSFQPAEKALKKLQRGANLLERTSNDKKVENLVQQVRDPRLFLYLTELNQNLLSIVLRWQKDAPAMNRAKVIKILSENWYWNNQKKTRIAYRKNETKEQWQIRKDNADFKLHAKQFAHLLEVRQLQMSLANFPEVFQEVNNALDRVFRSSSLVESFNSHIRLFQQVKKGFHKDFLALVALKWNMTPFEQGKRANKSPFQILGIQSENDHWLDLLLN